MSYEAEVREKISFNICVTIMVVTFMLTLTYCATNPHTSDEFWGLMKSEGASIKIESKDISEEDKEKTPEDGGQN